MAELPVIFGKLCKEGLLTGDYSDFLQNRLMRPFTIRR